MTQPTDRLEQAKRLVTELRKSCYCLNLEVVPSIAKDVTDRAEAVIALYEAERARNLELREQIDAFQEQLTQCQRECHTIRRNYLHEKAERERLEKVSHERD
jgi:hypothetical protein